MKNLFLSTILIIFIISFASAQKPQMKLIEGGEFMMGAIAGDAKDDKPLHKVTVDNFYMAIMEVTFEEFDWFSKTTGVPFLNDGGYGRGKIPAMNVSWECAIKYCNWLSSKHRYDKVYSIRTDSTGFHVEGADFSANGYRLPTEAEWEYAAKGAPGTTANNSSGTGVMGWYMETSENKPHEVGTSKSNRLGLYDMRGNVAEWCWDFYGAKYYSNSPENNPKGPNSGKHRVYRGGYFTSELYLIAPTKRYNLAPTIKTGMVGLRLVRSE